ncbi:MAG: PAS domain S-box protein [Gemmatimonadaceae bacterium]|nr:PAS domain S-box protein [Gemmatimonadaceae bacterium]
MNPLTSLSASAPAQTLREMLDAIDRAESTALRVQAAADALHDFGFDRVVVSLRDASLNPTFIAKAGSPEVSSTTGAGLKPLPGAVWRRRLPHLERYREGDLYVLDGSDEWVAREFFGSEPSGPSVDGRWLATDLIVGVLRGARQEVVGIVKIAGPRDGLRPAPSVLRDVDELLRLLGKHVSYDALEALARQRSERLQLLQDAGASLTRSLDEQEIMRELARQVQRAVRCDGVAILIPDLHNDTLTTAMRVVRGMERTRGVVRLGDGIVAEVARSGQPVRVGDRDADRLREKAGKALPLSMYDVVGESGAATSVLAVPMRVGIRLVGVLAVHSTLADVYADEDQEVLATMASQAATAIANARRYSESERERRTTEALADVARAVGESLRLGEVLRLILRHSISLLGVEGACIALRTGEYLHIVAAMGSADVLSGLHLPVGASLVGRAVLSNELILVNEFGPDMQLSRVVSGLMKIQRTIVAPLGTGRGTIGAVAVLNRERGFDQEDAKVLQRLADQVAVAIVNARLFEEVEKATREWKLAFDSTASGLVVLEEALTVSRCNARAAELCGSTIAGLLGKRFREALVGAGETPEGLNIDAFIARALREGQPVRGTVRVSSSGRLFTIIAAPHPDGGCVITFDDVSDASRLAEQHRAVLDTVSDGIVIIGQAGRITFANPAARALLQRHDLEGLPAPRFVAPEWNKTVRRHEALVRGGKAQQYECEIVCADGTRRLVEVGSTPLIELGEITGSVACLRDVTKQRLDAIARERSEALYTRLVDAATDAIFTVDLQGRFTSVNPAFLNEAGLTRAQVLGQHYVMLVDPADRREAEMAMAATLMGERRRNQLRCLGAQGSRLTMVTSAPIHEGGHVVGALGIVRDITNDEVQREARGQQARLAAIGQSLGRVANELNNPLASLLALAELQIDSPTLADDDRKALEQIVDEARRASRIVNQLLEGSSEVRSSTDQPGRIPLNTVLRRALDLQGYSLRSARIHLVTDLADTLLEVDGDPLQLQQVFTNIIANAEQALVDYTGERELRVQSRLEGPHVVVEIADSGPGIPASDLPRVIEPMFTTRSLRGHRGLGLTIAHAIVREHGGWLDVRSRHGEGVTCTVRLPLPNGADAGLRIATPVSTAAVGAVRSVLLIEDEMTLRTTISRFLRGQGYTVDLASNGRSALELLQQHRYDVILLDLRMSGMTGEEVYQTIEAAYPDQAAKVLFMTGDLHSEAASRFIRRTGRPVLAKPFTLADLTARLVDVIA